MLLSRIANSLFWMGRYLERAEHLSRFTKVHYFSALDAPQAQNKEDLLMSILKNVGLNHLYFRDHEVITENDVIFYVLLDLRNPYSIANTVNYARENARGARDSISSEIWEAVNKYYHYMNDVAFQPFDTDMTYNITQQILDYGAIIKGLVDNTMMHNDAYNMLSLGLHLERAIQVMRIIITKTDDIAGLEKSDLEKSIANYHWATLLKSAESFDMCNRFYRASPTADNTLEFLILNPVFPKSINYNLTRAYEHLEWLISFNKDKSEEFLFSVGKLLYGLKFMTIEEVLEIGANTYLSKSLEQVYRIAAEFERDYLSY